MMSEEIQDLINTEEIAKMLGIPWGEKDDKVRKSAKMKIYFATKKGLLTPIKKYGKRIYFDRPTVIKYLEKVQKDKETKEIKQIRSIDQVARYLGKHTSVVYAAIRNREIRYKYYENKKYYFTREEVERYKNFRKTTGKISKVEKKQLRFLKEKGYMPLNDWILLTRAPYNTIHSWKLRSKFTHYNDPDSNVTFVKPEIVEAYYNKMRKIRKRLPELFSINPEDAVKLEDTIDTIDTVDMENQP